MLRPGGVYLMISHSEPQARLQFLITPLLPWEVTVYVIGKQVGNRVTLYTYAFKGQNGCRANQCVGPMHRLRSRVSLCLMRHSVPDTALWNLSESSSDTVSDAASFHRS